MPKISILANTFAGNGCNTYGDETGSVTITLGAIEIITHAVRGRKDGTISVAGFVGRYATSTKAWPARVAGDGERVSACFGRDDRSGRFNKLNGVSWEPERFLIAVDHPFWSAV